MQESELYLVSDSAQHEEVDFYCFNKCGKIKVGAVCLLGAVWFPCRISHCPHEAGTLDMGHPTLLGQTEHVTIRRLRPLQAGHTIPVQQLYQ